MAVYKEEKTNTWRVIYRYTDWTGERKQSQKRGFKTKREALAWEREQLNKATADLDMTFASFVEQYTADMKTRIKENTWATKDHIIRTKLLPYFGKLKMCNITAQQIITWQNEMLDHKDENGKKYSPVYLRSVNSQLSAIFNHAVRYYNLRENPCKKAGSMGKKKNREMLFWTKEEYLKFAEVMMDKPLSFYAFEMLYWCGIREGELLALTPADFDFEKCTVSITKSYQRLNGQDLITTPKTEKSNRIIKMPQFLADEIQNQQVDVAAIEKIEAKPVPLSSKVILERSEYESLAAAAKKYVTAEKKESKLQKALDAANRLIAKLKAEISGLKQELAEYKSVRSKLRTSDLERENAELRGKVQRYEGVIQRNNLWHFFRPQRETAAMRDDAR